MKKLSVVVWIIIFIFFSISINSVAETIDMNPSIQEIGDNVQRNRFIEIKYSLFSPEIIFSDAKLQPIQAGLIGLGFGWNNFSVSILENSFQDSKRGGCDVSNSWKQYMFQFYYAKALGYKISTNENSSEYKELGKNKDLRSSQSGIIFMGLFDKEHNFSLLNSRDKVVLEKMNITSDFKYFYDFIYDQIEFKDSEEITPQSQILEQGRQSVSAGVGILVQEIISEKAKFASSCSLGLGSTSENQSYVSGAEKQKQSGIYVVNCLFNLNYANLQELNSYMKNWYLGSNGQMLVISPFQQDYMSHRTFILDFYIGTLF